MGHFLPIIYKVLSTNDFRDAHTLVFPNIAGWNVPFFNRKYIFNPGPPFFSQLWFSDRISVASTVNSIIFVAHFWIWFFNKFTFKGAFSREKTRTIKSSFFFPHIFEKLFQYTLTPKQEVLDRDILGVPPLTGCQLPPRLLHF